MEVVVLFVLGGSLVLSIAPALDAAMRSLSRAFVLSSFLPFLSHASVGEPLFFPNLDLVCHEAPLVLPIMGG